MGRTTKRHRIESDDDEGSPSPIPAQDRDKVRLPTKTLTAKFNLLKKRPHKSPRWYDESIAEELFMDEDIREIFRFMGAESLLDMGHSTYNALTSEFLATLRHDVEGFEGPISFRLGNQDRTITLEEWNAIFGFPNPKTPFKIDKYPLLRFWFMITGQLEFPKTALPNSSIAFPLFRVILRILGNTIWARKENSRPTFVELSCLYHMLFQVSWGRNLGFEMLEHMIEYASAKGEIWVGGMVTHLAIHFGVDLTYYTSTPPSFIDITYLQRANIIVIKRGEKFAGYADIDVPIQESRMDYKNRKNWYETWARMPLLRCSLSDTSEEDRNFRGGPPRVFSAEHLASERFEDDNNRADKEPMEEEFPRRGEARGRGSGRAGSSRAGEGIHLTSGPQPDDDLRTRVAGLRSEFDAQQTAMADIRTDVTGLRTDVSTLVAGFGTMQVDFKSMVSAQNSFFAESRARWVEDDKFRATQLQFYTESRTRWAREDAESAYPPPPPPPPPPPDSPKPPQF